MRVLATSWQNWDPVRDVAKGEWSFSGNNA